MSDDYDPTFYYLIEDTRTDEEVRRGRLAALYVLVAVAGVILVFALLAWVDGCAVAATGSGQGAPTGMSSAPLGSP